MQLVFHAEATDHYDLGPEHVGRSADRVLTVVSLEQKNAELAERNRLLAAAVRDLKEGTEAVEEIARKDLGMIRDGESFFLIVEPQQDPDRD